MKIGTDIVNIPEFKNYMSLFICLIGDFSWGFLPTDKYGFFPIDTKTSYDKNSFEVTFPPKDDDNNDKKTIICTQKHIPNTSSIMSFKLYIRDNYSGINQIFTIVRSISYDSNNQISSDNLEVNTPNINNSNYIQRNATELNGGYAAFLFIGQKHLYNYNVSLDPLNKITIYDKSKSIPGNLPIITYEGNIYNVSNNVNIPLICIPRPKPLISIMSKTSGMLISGSSVIPDNDFKCIYIFLAGGNLSAGFAAPIDGKFTDPNSYTNTNFVITQLSPTVLLIKNSLTNYGTIPETPLYIYDKISKLTQVFNISRTITETTVNPTVITNKYTALQNVYQIDSITDPKNATPQFLFFGPPISVSTSGSESNIIPTQTPYPIPQCNMVLHPLPPTSGYVNYIIPNIECKSNSNTLFNIYKNIKSANTKSINYIDPNMFINNLSVDETMDLILEKSDDDDVYEDFKYFNSGLYEYYDPPKMPNNFCLYSFYPTMIEIARNQSTDKLYCNACYAANLIMCLGDAFCMKFKVKSCYPSMMWMMSACGLKKNGKNICNFCTDGNSRNLLNWFVNDKGYTKLNSCWDYEKMLIDFCAPGTYNEDTKKCTLQQPNYFGNDKANDDACYSCKLTGGESVVEIKKNRLLSHVKFRINNYYIVNTLGDVSLKNKCFANKDYTKDEIDMIVYKIKCAVCSGSLLIKYTVTNGVSGMLRNCIENCIVIADPIYDSDDDSDDDSYDDSDYWQFQLDLKEIVTNKHCVSHLGSIVGWITGKDQYTNLDREYWKIRNSNGVDFGHMGCFFIPITTFETQKFCIGVDLPYNKIKGETKTKEYPCILIDAKEITENDPDEPDVKLFDNLIKYGILKNA